MAESIFTIEADQWSEHGYIYRDGQVMQYETDRKEQTHMEFSAVSAQVFIANENNPFDAREWVRQCTCGSISCKLDRHGDSPAPAERFFLDAAGL